MTSNLDFEIRYEQPASRTPRETGGGGGGGKRRAGPEIERETRGI